MGTASLEKWAPPEWFLNVNRNAYGEKAVELAQGIPATIEYLSMHWDIRITAPYGNMLQNFVVPFVRNDGSDAVLKISADRRMILRQAATLARLGGHGTIKLIDADLDRGALLMERATPGEPLNGSFDDETSALIESFRRLWRAPNQTRSVAIPSVTIVGTDWMPGEMKETRRALLANGMADQVAIVDEAERLLGDLLSSNKEEVLLHGDLHAGHLLSGKGRWLAIDPLGIFGERAFDVGTIFRDDRKSLRVAANPNELLAQRLYRLALELDVDWERIRGWGLVQAVYARNWRLKVGLPSPDWSISTKFLANSAQRLFYGVLGPLIASEELAIAAMTIHI